ncbi:MAG TPA: hypothetical protein VFA02_02085 [Pseudacidobacterium sp.]|jgi:hypothetical protein|nr:hypothetical protein [Pseudacidobacterium sp.]
MAIYIAKTGRSFLAADRVWIATALLHKENPKRTGFSLNEICEKARQEGFLEETTNTFYLHANQHCVANRTPNPGNHRMLFEPSRGERRLYRPGDLCKPGRVGKITPNPDDIPPKYRYLLDWYNDWSKRSAPQPPLDRLLQLKGSGKDLWKDEHADEYVDRLRKGWE